VTVLSAPASVGAPLVSVLITPADALTVSQTVGSRVSVTLADSLTTLGAGSNVSAALAPAITVVSPASGSRGASGLSVTLTGSGMTDATQVQFFARSGSSYINDSAITVTNLSTTPDGTQATVTINIGTTAILAAHVVRITAGGATSTAGGTGANLFTVNP
jgi:hypothetical protein